MMDNMTLPEKLRLLCRERGLSYTKLADELGGIVSRGTTGNWLTGKSEPTLSVAKKLAELLGVSLDYLADDSLEVIPSRSPVDEEMLALLYNAKRIGVAEANRRILNPGSDFLAVPDDPKLRRRSS